MAEEGQQAEEQTTEEQPQQEENRGLLATSDAAPVTEDETQQDQCGEIFLCIVVKMIYSSFNTNI